MPPTDDEQMMAGMKRSQVPYLEWPHAANPKQMEMAGRGRWVYLERERGALGVTLCARVSLCEQRGCSERSGILRMY